MKLLKCIWVVFAVIWLLRIWGYADYRLRLKRAAEHCGQIINGTYSYCGGKIPTNVVFLDVTRPMGFWDNERRLLREWGVTK